MFFWIVIHFGGILLVALNKDLKLKKWGRFRIYQKIIIYAYICCHSCICQFFCRTTALRLRITGNGSSPSGAVMHTIM